jgi:hypothetical protein
MRYMLWIAIGVVLIFLETAISYRQGKHDADRWYHQTTLDGRMTIRAGTNVVPDGFNGDDLSLFCPYYFNLTVRNQSWGIDGIVMNCKNPNPALGLPVIQQSGSATWDHPSTESGLKWSGK